MVVLWIFVLRDRVEIECRVRSHMPHLRSPDGLGQVVVTVIL